jgi:ArsR family transcriptional regulator
MKVDKMIDIKEVSQIMKLLGDKTRLTIMKLLQSQDFCVCEFVEIFNMSQPAISQHLRKLKDAGLVKESRKRQWVYYSMNNEHEYVLLIEDLLKYLPDQNERLVELEAQGLRISCD